MQENMATAASIAMMLRKFPDNGILFFGLWWSAERVSVRSTDYLVCISWRIAAPGALRLTRRYKLPRKLHHRLFTFCLGRRYITTEQPTGRLCPAF